MKKHKPFHSTPDLFHFEWPVDQSGYEAVSIEEAPGTTAGTVLTSPFGTGWNLRRKGGPLRFFRPLDEPGLFRRFAHLKKYPDAILSFANEFGMLGAGLVGPPLQDDWEEHALWWWTHIDGFRVIVNLIDAEKLLEAGQMFNDYTQPLTTVRVHVDPPKRHSLHIEPTNLIAAMWLQVAGQITRGSKFKRCEWCENWWPYGDRTGHKVTKRFCSDRCRKASNRHQRKEPNL